MTALTKKELTAALTVAGIAIPRKANVAVLTELHNTMMASDSPKRNADGTVCLDRPVAPANLIAVGDADAPAPVVGSFEATPEELAAQTMRPTEGGDEEPAAPAPDAPAATSEPRKGISIEKDREERNGIKRPSAGGRCRAVWDACDAFAEQTGDDPTAADVRNMAAEHGWNANNASIEFYQWRKFNGITGRAAKVAAE